MIYHQRKLLPRHSTVFCLLNCFRYAGAAKIKAANYRNKAADQTSRLEVDIRWACKRLKPFYFDTRVGIRQIASRSCCFYHNISRVKKCDRPRWWGKFQLLCWGCLVITFVNRWNLGQVKPAAWAYTASPPLFITTSLPISKFGCSAYKARWISRVVHVAVNSTCSLKYGNCFATCLEKPLS